MCKPSVVALDWVTKGCHIHIGKVELRVCTDHRGELMFKRMFGSTLAADVNAAIAHAWKNCLPDKDIREKWKKGLERGRRFVLGMEGRLERNANGKMFDFKMTRIAIQRWEEKNGLV